MSLCVMIHFRALEVLYEPAKAVTSELGCGLESATKRLVLALLLASYFCLHCSAPGTWNR